MVLSTVGKTVRIEMCKLAKEWSVSGQYDVCKCGHFRGLHHSGCDWKANKRKCKCRKFRLSDPPVSYDVSHRG